MLKLCLDIKALEVNFNVVCTDPADMAQTVKVKTKPRSTKKSKTRAITKVKAKAKAKGKSKPKIKGSKAPKPKAKKVAVSKKIEKSFFDRLISLILPKKSSKKQIQSAVWVIGAFGSLLAVLLMFALGNLKQNQLDKSGELSEQFNKASQIDFNDRIGFWSTVVKTFHKSGKQLLHTSDAPSVSDFAPILPGHYNCTTYVETVAALAKSNSGKQVYRNLLNIRYRNGQATFENRNHFPAIDWIPNNVNSGVLRDITKEIAKKAETPAQSITKTFHKLKWFQKQKKANRSLSSISEPTWADTTSGSLDYIPLEEFRDALPHIPQGAILNIVRENNDRFPTLVTHQGFLIRLNGKIFFRHASSLNPNFSKIRTIEIEKYLSDLEDDYKKRKVAGININQLIY